MANPKPEKSYKVARSVAEDEFERWATALGLDHKFDEDFVDPLTLKAMGHHRNVVVRAIMCGHAVVDEKAELIFTPQHSPDKEPLKFRRPTGADFKIMDKHRDGTARNLALLSALTKANDDVFDKMDFLYDGDFCASVVALFLA